MKKVAIMTYHDMVNYGSLFQMYCLQNTISELGFKVKIINYRPNINYIKRAVNDIPLIKFLWIKTSKNTIWLNFNKFYTKYINKTKTISSDKDFRVLNKQFDFFVAGSDQIWSPNHFDIKYFLDFVEENNKRISYAPSVVINNFNTEQITTIKKELKKYKAISVREKTGKKILKENFNIDSTVVIDPTLIANLHHFKKILKNNSKKNLNCNVLCYFLGNNDYEKKILKIFNTKNNNKIINISLDKNNNFEKIENINDASPEEFLTYLNNCDIVCTDSFHGVALSIKLNKQFIVFNRFKSTDPICQNARIEDLLNILEISNVNYIDYISNKYKSIDYKTVQPKLEKLAAKSYEYLKNALEVNNNEQK